jgi:acyl-CoA synthetase (NDP forming)
MGERSGTEGLARGLSDALAEARATEWRGPVINGGNCLGILSRPGRYNTLFIPEHKLPVPPGPGSPVAVLSQSGAFVAAKLSRLRGIDPTYLVSLGNQTDLTLGDYLTYLKDDPELKLFACYVEGFRPGDGLRWLDAAAEITAGGRAVILYRAGRSTAGARASASHTAAIAGDHRVTCELAQAAGVTLADSLEDFEDLIALFCLLEGRQVRGWRLGALSNAGYECVAIADHAGAFELPPFGAATTSRLGQLLGRSVVGSIVDVHNPLDVTPMLEDAAFAEAARLLLEDDGFDVGLIGCVPMTPELATLAASPTHGENLLDEGSVASRLIALRSVSPKAWVAVVDAGALYDPFAAHLQAHGVPTFRSADRALRLFEKLCRFRLRH